MVLLDGRGKQLSSEELAKFLGDYQDRNPLPLLFAVGGADGFSDQARQAATLVLSLGKMTLAHELARVVMLEQLYRGVHHSKRLTPITWDTEEIQEFSRVPS